MSYLPVVNARASVPAVMVDDLDDAAAGAFEFYSDSAGADAGIIFKCPCGCGSGSAMNFRAQERPAWSWDGNREQPTATPSMLIHQVDASGAVIGEHWHGYLTAGEWRSC